MLEEWLITLQASQVYIKMLITLYKITRKPAQQIIYIVESSRSKHYGHNRQNQRLYLHMVELSKKVPKRHKEASLKNHVGYFKWLGRRIDRRDRVVGGVRLTAAAKEAQEVNTDTRKWKWYTRNGYLI